MKASWLGKKIMNTYEKEIIHNGKEYYICTEYGFDHADRLQLSGFVLTDEDGEDISQDDFEANEDLYDHVSTILANHDAPCYGGAPC
jgi:hypothetical protein